MLILQDRKFIQAQFDSEAEIEAVVIKNAEYIFGPSSLYFPKMLFKTGDGAGTIPDGFVIDPSTSQWYVVEAELAKHNVWSHIAPQVAKQIIAASQPATRQLVIEVAVKRIKEDPTEREKLTELGFEEIDIPGLLSKIVEQKPVIGLPIDSVSRDLQEWATTLKNEVKLWIVKKYVEFGHPENVLYEYPDEYQPALDTQEEVDAQTGSTRYDVTLLDLIHVRLLEDGEKLLMLHRPRGGEPYACEGTVQADGSIEVLDKVFGSPSYAALYVLQTAGSKRKSINGWTAWMKDDQTSLAELRDLYFETLGKTAKDSD